MAGLDEPDYWTEQSKTAETGGVSTITAQTEQTESGQVNDEDIDNFIAENRNNQKDAKWPVKHIKCFTDGQKLRELLKTYQNKNWTNFWLTFF